MSLVSQVMSDNESTGSPGLDASAQPADLLAEAMYPDSNDHRRYVVDLELDFFHGTIVVQDGIVVRAPQMLKWTQEYPDGNDRETAFADVLEWYQRPGKKDEDGGVKAPEFVSAKVVRILG